MRPTVVRGATHLFAAPANWKPETDGECGDLQVRADCFGKRNIVELTSAWKPNAAELSHIIRGGVIEISICAATQPAMRVGVVEPVDPSNIRYVRDDNTPHPDEPEKLDGEPGEQRPITINEEAHGQ